MSDRTWVIAFVSIILGGVIAIVAITAWGINQQHNCRERGGIPYRSTCLDPGAPR